MVAPKLASGEADLTKLGLTDEDGVLLIIIIFAVSSVKALEARRDKMRTIVMGSFTGAITHHPHFFLSSFFLWYVLL